MNIVTIVGARPQFVKAGVVSRALKATAGVREIIVHTGQHYDENMSKIFFDELEIPRPAYNLEIGSGSHGEQTGRMLAAIEAVLSENRPDWTLVYGDTNSTLAGSLAASKLHIPVAHVEAGLRSFNRRMPEEINRTLTDHVSDLLFAPTSTATAHLLREGIPAQQIKQVGDVMYDAALFYADKARTRSEILRRSSVELRKYLLATIHRAENTDDENRLRVICDALSLASQELPVIFPIHPRTRKRFSDLGLQMSTRVQLIDPVGYLDMVALEMNAKIIATDSGGVQKEAYFYRVPCVTLRDETEWVELVDMGWNRLVPPIGAAAVAAELLKASPPSTDPASAPFGNGDSAAKIRDILLDQSHSPGVLNN